MVSYDIGFCATIKFSIKLILIWVFQILWKVSLKVDKSVISEESTVMLQLGFSDGWFIW